MALSLPPFQNEPYSDFSKAVNRQAMDEALARVRSELGRAYPLWIAGGPVETGDMLVSTNPSHQNEIIGSHHKATPDLARRAIEDAFAYFPKWSATPVDQRVQLLCGAATLLRQRKEEFNAWLILESGKNWNEAEADTAEAIDFCEYYARQMLRWDNPEPLIQMPGEVSKLVYIPLGVGVVIPPWNFPLAILVGMTVAALVAGNTVVIKPSSETPIIAAKFVELLLEAGFPERSVALCTGSGSVVGDLLVTHPKTRFVSFTGSREVGLHINELAAKHQVGQLWIRRVVAEMGGKDAIIVDEEADLDTAVTGVMLSAFGFQGQKCSACSRAIVSAKLYDAFLEKLKAKVETIRQGPAENVDNYMGPVISESAQKTILKYMDVGRTEGRVLTGGGIAPGDGWYLLPTVIADVSPNARIFQEEIFGPLLAVTKAKDFDEALAMANNTEYGLTGAVYSLNPTKLALASQQFHVGNLYLNRKCTGAMVGAHPFGGFNMSGTDSKAGGPDYLLQFLQGKLIAEKVL